LLSNYHRYRGGDNKAGSLRYVIANNYRYRVIPASLLFVTKLLPLLPLLVRGYSTPKEESLSKPYLSRFWEVSGFLRYVIANNYRYHVISASELLVIKLSPLSGDITQNNIEL
jgi:hypothetical protein